MLKRIVLISGFTGMLMTLQAQGIFPVPEPGKPYPNPAVLLVEKEQGVELVSLPKYKGTPLIVEFFSSLCTVCFKAMPKLNQLQEHFNGRMKFLVIGKEDGKVRRIYETFKKKFQLKLDVAYDSVLHKDIRSFPYPLYVWIDAKGIVQALTGVEDVNEKNIEKFVAGKQVDITLAVDKIDFDLRRPILINGNGGDDASFLSRSLFTLWNKNQYSAYPIAIKFDEYRDSLQFLGIPLSRLYQLAYFNETEWHSGSDLYGKVFPFPVFEDGSLMTMEKFPTFYNYSLWLSADQLRFTSIQEQFQADLESQFGYSASIEYRVMPYHSVQLRKGYENQLRTRGDSFFMVSHGGLGIRRFPMKKVVNCIGGKLFQELPFVDETGIDFLVDVTISAVMSDLNAVKLALYEVGLEIRESVRPMRVLMLRRKF